MEYIVIKCGGSIVDQLPQAFYKNIAQIQQSKKVKPIIVHGGGALISSRLKQMNVATTFVNGLRVTTSEVLDVVEMVLSGSVNKQIVRNIMQEGVSAFGMSGIDGNLLHANKAEYAKDLGYVGDIDQVNVELLKNVMAQGFIPVVSPIAIGKEGQRYNVNADTAAAAIAQALQAKLCFISDIPGIYVEENGEKTTLHYTDKAQIESLIKTKVIQGGMIPKVKAALTALAANVPEVSIVNGMDANALPCFVDGKEVGTRIRLEEASHV
ncbi:acetylglutamate kinase [Paraliobacillus quinghaiensis]|uniref:Acetylglutamate kinase n=1 Tax=Paraliobacillus quinghaiensis TaxID=470815 RepID=A0A917TWZ1_9BACI|nr:acetylglutamate kinase [Paraliobacillus quinghaiensis]GGM41681.1 acetylglutamate kinase [Paraliobacillus quinghaiensis]